MEFVSQMTKEEFKSLLKATITEVLSQIKNEGKDEDQLLNVKEASLFLGLAVATLYEKTSERLIPHYKQGKKIVFKKSELIKWIESRRIPTIEDIKAEAIRRLGNSRYR